MCSICKNGPLGKVLQDASLIIWDEYTMTHITHVKALNTTLKDIGSSNKVMDGIILMFSYNFRQTLPIIVKETRANII